MGWRHAKINFSLGELSQHVLKSSPLKAKPPTGASQHPPGQQDKPADCFLSAAQNILTSRHCGLLPERLVAIGVTFVQCPVWGSYLSTEFSMFSPS